MISTHNKKDAEQGEDHVKMEEFPSQKELTNRIKKTLYYGHGYMPKTDRPSLPLTEIAVELFQDASPRDLGQVDTFLASSMARKACMSPCSMMLGMIFIERLKNRNPEYLQKMSSADLFFVSMMMASKYLYDEGTDDEVFNDEWAESADMELDELNKLERNFLSAIDWRLYVHPHQFWKKLHETEHRIAIDKGKERGWFSYTDIDVLTQDPSFRGLAFSLVSVLGKIVLVCSVAYTAAVATLVASTMATVCLRERIPVQPIALPVTLWPFKDGQTDMFSSVETGLLATREMNEMAEDPKLSDQVLPANESKESDADGRTQAKKPQAVGFSGFLTLALLQDTMYKFMSGVSDKMKSLYNSEGNGSQSETGCKCNGVPCRNPAGVFRYPSNFTSFQGSLNAKDLRCTCGKNARNKNKVKYGQSENKVKERYQGTAPGIFSGNIVWNKILGISANQQKQSVNKGSGSKHTDLRSNHHTCDCENGDSCDPDGTTKHLLNCMLKLQLPFSELALAHGHTVTPMLVTS